MHWGSKWQPTPVFLPKKPQGHGNLLQKTQTNVFGQHNKKDNQNFKIDTWELATPEKPHQVLPGPGTSPAFYILPHSSQGRRFWGQKSLVSGRWAHLLLEAGMVEFSATV